jgi:hypothetical protein
MKTLRFLLVAGALLVLAAAVAVHSSTRALGSPIRWHAA